jgi:hypothetical protein
MPEMLSSIVALSKEPISESRGQLGPALENVNTHEGLSTTVRLAFSVFTPLPFFFERTPLRPERADSLS